MRRPQRASGLELRRVLGEGGSDAGAACTMTVTESKARQGHGHKSIWRLQQVRGLAIAAGMSQVMHAECFLFLGDGCASACRSGAKIQGRRPARSRRPRDGPTRRDDELMPPGLRRKIIVLGTRSAKIMASCPAPLTMESGSIPILRMDVCRQRAQAGIHGDRGLVHQHFTHLREAAPFCDRRRRGEQVSTAWWRTASSPWRTSRLARNCPATTFPAPG